MKKVRASSIQFLNSSWFASTICGLHRKQMLKMVISLFTKWCDENVIQRERDKDKKNAVYTLSDRQVHFIKLHHAFITWLD